VKRLTWRTGQRGRAAARVIRRTGRDTPLRQVKYCLARVATAITAPDQRMRGSGSGGSVVMTVQYDERSAGPTVATADGARVPEHRRVGTD